MGNLSELLAGMELAHSGEWASAPSLDTPSRRNSTTTTAGHPVSDAPSTGWSPQRKRPRCPDSYIFQEGCGHGNWRWRRVPCNKWGCNPCSRWRVENELIPELTKAIEWSLSMDTTPKFLTLTWQGSLPAAQSTHEGARLRALHIQKLVRWIRTRPGGYCHYLRVSETHKTGKIHVHMVVVMPFILQAQLSDRWAFYSGSRVLDIRTLYSKCPTPDCKEKVSGKWGRSRVIPKTSHTSGKCRVCGYSPRWDNPESVLEVASEAARYTGKYLTKQDDIEALKRRMNRSQAWNLHCRPEREVSSGAYCSSCEDEHSFTYSFKSDYEPGYPGLDGATCTSLVAYVHSAGEPCSCWKPRVWRQASCDSSQAKTELLVASGVWKDFFLPKVAVAPPVEAPVVLPPRPRPYVRRFANVVYPPITHRTVPVGQNPDGSWIYVDVPVYFEDVHVD